MDGGYTDRVTSGSATFTFADIDLGADGQHEITVTAETMYSEVVTFAKRNLKPGEKLNGIGSADIFGKIYKYNAAKVLKAIPIGIAEKGVVLKEIQKGELLTENNFIPDQSTFIYQLRKEQDAWIS